MTDYIHIIENRFIFGSLVTVCLAATFFIDTSCWCVRGVSPQNKIGLYTSKTNIYSYFGRLFTFTYMSIISIRIDVGMSVKDVALYICIGFFVGAVFQALLLNTTLGSRYVLSAIARLLRVEIDDKAQLGNQQEALQMPLLASTFMATFLFCAGLSLPYILAAALPEYRLTMSSLGQVLNALGMIFILIYVDQRLYRSWDSGHLGKAMYSYRRGRLAGILFSSVIMLVLFQILKA